MTPATLIKKNRQRYGNIILAVTKAFGETKVSFDPTTGDVIEIADKIYRELTKHNLLK